MKIGLILECGPSGADKPVCEHLIKMIDPSIEISTITLNNKLNLISNCGKSASILLKEKCDKVIIVWDLYPSWKTENPKKPCLLEDIEKIKSSLSNENIKNNIYLICIIQELEAWLLADESAISNFISKPHRPITIRSIKDPESIQNPKDKLNKIFTQNLGSTNRYNDLIHAKKIVENLSDLKKLEKKCSTFIRFRDSVNGKAKSLSFKELATQMLIDNTPTLPN